MTDENNHGLTADELDAAKACGMTPKEYLAWAAVDTSPSSRAVAGLLSRAACRVTGRPHANSWLA